MRPLMPQALQPLYSFAGAEPNTSSDAQARGAGGLLRNGCAISFFQPLLGSRYNLPSRGVPGACTTWCAGAPPSPNHHFAPPPTVPPLTWPSPPSSYRHHQTPIPPITTTAPPAPPTPSPTFLPLSPNPYQPTHPFQRASKAYWATSKLAAGHFHFHLGHFRPKQAFFSNKPN